MIQLLRKLNVLVVDDEIQICEMISIFLSTTGYFANIVLADSVILAKQKLSNQPFDLIIIDNIMPQKKGMDLIKYLSKVKIKGLHFKYAQVIFMSGALTPDDVIFANRYGIKNILVKPFTKKKLIYTVNETLNLD